MARQYPARYFGADRERKPEAVFASAVMKYLRQMYGKRLWEVAIRGGLGMRSGIPDRLCCIDGCMVAIEFKNPDGTGRLGPKQKLEIDRIRESGGLAVICQSWDDIEIIFERFKPNQGRIK